MKLYLKIFLSISISICVVDCSTPYSCSVNPDPENFSFEPIVHLTENKPVLYTSEFHIMNYTFSGLIAFRKMQETSETRIVFLSEVGLKLMEFNYKNGLITNNYCILAANRKQVKKFVAKFLLLLLEEPVCKTICMKTADENNIYFCKNHKRKLSAKTSGNYKRSASIKKEYGIATGTYSKSESPPEIIEVRMKHKTRINLKRLDNAFK
ncbi:MAG: hypothetical protein JXB24_10185 [Bacteroidales bacterium]|nr:hypothetical protein [Bacteroidales bacterium]